MIKFVDILERDLLDAAARLQRQSLQTEQKAGASTNSSSWAPWPRYLSLLLRHSRASRGSGTACWPDRLRRRSRPDRP